MTLKHKVYHSRRHMASAALACGVWLGVLLLGNRQSIVEGFRYLAALLCWRPTAGQRVQSQGAFASCYELINRTNSGRYEYIRTQLIADGLEVIKIAVPGEALPNLFVRIGPPGAFTLLVAHYDKARETANYQGASDNTAAVAVLLAALHNLSGSPPQQALGVLFSAAEERGLLGAQAFLHYSQAQRLEISAVLNFDMLGRDELAIRPSALPGYYFWLPFLGQIVYDGRHLRRAAAYRQPNQKLIQRLTTLSDSRLIVYQRFTARSDSNVFQDAGIPTVAISSANMFYLDLVWERDTDRVELLDERNLERARSLILAIASQSASSQD